MHRIPSEVQLTRPISRNEKLGKITGRYVVISFVIVWEPVNATARGRELLRKATVDIFHTM